MTIATFNPAKIIFIVLISIFLQSCGIWQNPENHEKQKYNQIAANTNVELGLAYLQQHDSVRAKEKLLRALQQAPDWEVSQDAMAYFLENTGNKAAAEKYYQQAVKNNSALACNNYGNFLCRDHRPLEAEKMFLKAVDNPVYLNTAKAYENAGLCALTIPDKIKAKIYFQKALQQDALLSLSQQELRKLNV